MWEGLTKGLHPGGIDLKHRMQLAGHGQTGGGSSPSSDQRHSGLRLSPAGVS